MRFVARRFTVSQCNVLDALVVPSRAMEQALLDYGVRCPMHIIPTGMEMERFAGGDGQRFRAQLGIAPGQPVLVHVGRIAHEKNIEFLFRMFARVVRSKPGAVFVVAGEGPALASCKAYVRSLGIDAARALRRLSVARARAARLLPRRRSVRLLLADRDPGPGAARSDGARRPGRLDGAHGNGGHRQSAARRARGPRRRRPSSRTSSCKLLEDAPRRAAMSAEARAYAATWSASAMADRLAGLYSAVVGQASRNSPVSQPV